MGGVADADVDEDADVQHPLELEAFPDAPPLPAVVPLADVPEVLQRREGGDKRLSFATCRASTTTPSQA